MSVSFKFAHLSDTHVRPDAPRRSQFLVDHLAEIAAGEYAFVVHTGDLMDEPSAWAARAFRTMASMVRIPLHVTPGNHDVYNPRVGEIEAPWWAKLAVNSGLETCYKNWFGPGAYAFSYQGTWLVALDSLIINSGLPEEQEQWVWLEKTLAELAARRPEHLVLFTHMPLFIHEPYEELDLTDFRNRYLVVSPPGRDRVLGLIRRYRVGTVLCGHLHVPWETAHTWPEGFTTNFIVTGSSGPASAMATEHFNLPVTPAEGIGYHEHCVEEGVLSSRFNQHPSGPLEGCWRLGRVWTTSRRPEGWNGSAASPDWVEVEYCPSPREWQASDPKSPFHFPLQEGMAYYVRQTFETETGAAGMYLELATERAVRIYLNGELLYDLSPLGQRPPAWQSAGGNYSIDTPMISLGLNQRLVHKGENVVALWLGAGALASAEGYIAYRTLDPPATAGPSTGQDVKEVDS